MSIQQLRKAAEWIRGRKKEQLLISVLLLGLFLVIIMPVKETDEMKETQKTEEETLPQTPAEEEAAAKQMERQLVETLSQVEGVGEVKAAVTLETSGKRVVEKDVPVSTSDTSQTQGGGESQESFSSDSQEETVYERDSDGNETPYVVQETTPEIRGVVVVAKGGGDPVIQRQIQEAVMALFHVEAHKIKVMKMK